MSLDDRLRDAAADLRTATEAQPAGRPDRRLLLAAAMVVLVVLAAAVALRAGDHAPVTTDRPTGPVPSTATTAIRAGAAWFVAGTTRNGTPVVWRSTDGATWREVWRAARVIGGSGSVPHLVRNGDELVLLTSGTGGTAAWSSREGRAWKPTTAFPTDWYADAASFHGQLVAVGQAKGSEVPDALLRLDADRWVRVGTDLPRDLRVTAMAVHGGELLLAGNLGEPASTPPVIFHSLDSKHWSGPIRLGDLPGWAMDVASNGANVLAPISVPGHGGQLWSATDAGSWHRIDGAPVAYQLGARESFVTVGRTFVRVGSDRFLDSSTDGLVWTRLPVPHQFGSEAVAAPGRGQSILLIEPDGDRWRSRFVTLR